MEIIYPTSFLNFIEEKESNDDLFNYRSLNDSDIDNYESSDLDNEFNRYPESNPFPGVPNNKQNQWPEIPNPLQPQWPNMSKPLDNQWPGNYNFGPNSKPPMGPPPSYTPSKSGKNVKYLGDINHTGPNSPNGPMLKYVSDDSIRFCLYKYTYIWQRNGRSYWAFLVQVDRRSIAGFRWINYRWSYFGLDLRSVDSFQCY